MRRLIGAVLVAGIALPGVALARIAPAMIGGALSPRAAVMRDPVIASIGHVRTQVPANRAGFAASFQSIDRSAAVAFAKAAEQMRVVYASTGAS